jgi:hypothetical protein
MVGLGVARGDRPNARGHPVGEFGLAAKPPCGCWDSLRATLNLGSGCKPPHRVEGLAMAVSHPATPMGWLASHTNTHGVAASHPSEGFRVAALRLRM